MCVRTLPLSSSTSNNNPNIGLKCSLLPVSLSAYVESLDVSVSNICQSVLEP